jgi:hypothetical protein
MVKMEICSDSEDQQIFKLNEYSLIAYKIQKAGHGPHLGFEKFKCKKPNPGGNVGAKDFQQTKRLRWLPTAPSSHQRMTIVELSWRQALSFRIARSAKKRGTQVLHRRIRLLPSNRGDLKLQAKARRRPW